MKKAITFCASLAFFLGISSGANAVVVFDFTTDPAGCGIVPVPGSCGSPVQTPTPSSAVSIDEQIVFQVAAPALLFAGTLTVPHLFLNDGSGGFATVKLFQELPPLAFTDPPTADGTAFGGAGSVPASVTVNFVGGTPVSDTYNIIANLASSPAQYFIDIQALTGSSGTYSVLLTTFVPVPLPPAAVLFLSALAGLVGFSRNRRRKPVA